MSPTTEYVDLTMPRSPSPRIPHTKHYQHPTHRTFRSAYRRITHRERLISASNVAERTRTTEETPLPPHRERALLHVSRAYTVAAYSHAALLAIVAALSAVAACFFAHSVAGDILRKTRLRADDINIQAMQCRRNLHVNGCLLDGAIAHHLTPALDGLCRKWVACERRARFAWIDAASASIWAETLAETFNSFANKISSTAVLISVIIAIVGSVLISTAAFGFLHNKVVDDRVVRLPPVHDNDAIVSFPNPHTRALTPASSRRSLAR